TGNRETDTEDETGNHPSATTLGDFGLGILDWSHPRSSSQRKKAAAFLAVATFWIVDLHQINNPKSP
ncbi:MAG: hypothetical protein ACE10K_03090, partial [Rhodothermales bacterium]